MIRLSLLLLSFFSLIYGVFFLIFPFNFVVLTEAEFTNIAWLRSIGAAITGLLFIGLFYISVSPKRTIKLLYIISITSTIQTSALLYSRFFNEFSANKIIIIDFTIYSALFVTIYLIFISLKYKHLFD